jgi:hypothetical protein
MIIRSDDDAAAFPLTETEIFPVDAVSGTVTTSWVLVAETTEAETPLMLTLSELTSVLKLVPVKVTGYPIPLMVGENFVIDGCGAGGGGGGGAVESAVLLQPSMVSIHENKKKITANGRTDMYFIWLFRG